MPYLASAWALIVWAAVVMAVAVWRRLRSSSARTDGPIRPLVARTSALAATAVTVCGVEVAVAASNGRFGLGLLLAGPLFCLVVAAASLVAELAVRPSTTPRRRATVSSRRFLDYVGRAQLVAVSVVFAGAAAFLGTTSMFGSADDKGRPGRWLSLPSLDARYSGATILWPGAYYAVPLLAALGLTLLAVGTALRRIAARPRPGTTPVAADEDMRRSSAEVVLAVGGVAGAAVLCGAGLVAASGFAQAGGLWMVLSVTLWVLVAAAAAVGAWSAAILVTPGRTGWTHRTAVAA